MMECTLKIIDQVNVKFEGLDPSTRKKMLSALSFIDPKARHTPAYKLGRWDGKTAFATIGGRTFVNLLDKALPIIIDAGYEVNIIDDRPDYGISFDPIDSSYLSSHKWPEGHPKAGESIILNDHQVEAVNDYLKPNAMGSHHSLQQISTSAGKTIITTVLSKETEKYGRSLVIVPGKDLVTQTQEDYVNLNLDTGMYYGDHKDYDNTHMISTWQSLTRLSKSDPMSFKRITNGVFSLIIDEAHSIRGTELKNMLTRELAHIPLRWALSGTIPKEPHEFNCLLASIGPKVGEVRADTLQKKGILSNCFIDIMQLQDSVEYNTYPAETEYLSTDRTRAEYMAEEIRKIGKEGNTLVLVNRIDLGEKLAEILGAPFINGKVVSKERKEEYKSINEVDNKIIIATSGVAATGINIPRIFNLVLIEVGKSYVRTIQAIGRGLRKAKDKDFVNIYDICSSAKYSKRHLTERKKFYKEAGYPFKVRKIKYR